MIQRIQSLWLFLAGLCGAGVLYFDLYRASFPSGSPIASQVLRTADHYPSLLVALVMIFLPLVAIFMYRNRKRQRAMTMVSILATLSFIGIVLTRVAALGKMTPPPATGSYWIGAILPAFSFVLLVMALFGINKDEKLVRSMDRLR